MPGRPRPNPAAPSPSAAPAPKPLRKHVYVGAHAFYADVLATLANSGVPFLVGGGWAVIAYTQIDRPVKDVDVFCRAGDYPRILAYCKKQGYEIQVEDERWIAKILRGKFFCDVIFSSANAVAPVNEGWFEQKCWGTVLGVRVRLLPPTELVWSKALIMDRARFDGADVAHVIMKQHEHINWPRLLSHMNQYWEVLLVHLLLFRFIYPSMRHVVPDAIMDELLARLEDQRGLPDARKRACRGRIFSRDDYKTDIQRWGYADLIGDDRT
jgi:hypothetical protein